MNRDDVCSAFLDAVPFELYSVQEEALLAWFEEEEGGGVLVTAPTGMGKTLIAEAAVFEALQSGQRMYYTTPLIALTEQKFRELADRAEAWGFPRTEVGLITGNRRENPDARVRVVVAEILLNHLLSEEERLDDVSAVVMDEFHNFNDFERGIVWELSLVLLPKHVRLMLLSATVGNAPEFVSWLRTEHGRKIRLVQSDERRVPLEYVWVGDKLLTEHLPTMASEDDHECRTPALVFCFNRDECWEVAERLKGLCRPVFGASTASRTPRATTDCLIASTPHLHSTKRPRLTPTGLRKRGSYEGINVHRWRRRDEPGECDSQHVRHRANARHRHRRPDAAERQDRHRGGRGRAAPDPRRFADFPERGLLEQCRRRRQRRGRPHLAAAGRVRAAIRSLYVPRRPDGVFRGRAWRIERTDAPVPRRRQRDGIRRGHARHCQRPDPQLDHLSRRERCSPRRQRRNPHDDQYSRCRRRGYQRHARRQPLPIRQRFRQQYQRRCV
ncbi:MAG: DEAD/DEAH box helicase [bacterium]|nr:DEAD/DEAH box helicase [bacterium]